MSARNLIANADTALGFVAPEFGRLRFTAADPRLTELDGTVFDSAGAARRLAEAVLAAGGTPDHPTGGKAASRALAALLHRQPIFQTWG
jgi:hypothetical protein